MCPRYGTLFRLQEVHFDLDLNLKVHVNLICINMHESALVFQILTTLHSLDDHHWRKHMGASTIYTHISKMACEGAARRRRIFSFFLCSQHVPFMFPSMGSHQVPNVFPNGVPNSTSLSSHMFYPKPSFSQLYRWAKWRATPSFHKIFYFGETFHSFNLFLQWANQNNSLQKKKVGLVRHPQLINMKQNKYYKTYKSYLYFVLFYERSTILLSMWRLLTRHERRWFQVSLIDQQVQLQNLTPLLRSTNIEEHHFISMLWRCTVHLGLIWIVSLGNVPIFLKIDD